MKTLFQTIFSWLGKRNVNWLIGSCHFETNIVGIMSATAHSSSISVILPQLMHHGFVSLSEEDKGDSQTRQISVKLKPWNAVKSIGTSHDIIHIPSINVSHHYSSKVDGVQYYEERALYHLFHLNDPSTKVVLITSVPVSQCVVDYYIGLLDGISRESARQRLHM